MHATNHWLNDACTKVNARIWNDPPGTAPLEAKGTGGEDRPSIQFVLSRHRCFSSSVDLRPKFRQECLSLAAQVNSLSLYLCRSNFNRQQISQQRGKRQGQKPCLFLKESTIASLGPLVGTGLSMEETPSPHSGKAHRQALRPAQGREPQE